ncbi:MAG: UvrD-helicase domain-containing protein, partial [Caldiserica bacterium]|nr:UvrD-helicase domain-containing protein [Caldisericota bacterium]
MIDWLEDLNEEQKEAVFHTDGPLLILAGAGSGKTRVIAYRIAYLIQRRGVPANSILAVTFTNKAAGEMKQRVESLIGRSIKGMWIGTFHAVCARILRIECQKLDFKPNFLIMDEDDSEHLIKEAEKSLDLKGSLGKPSSLRERISFLKNNLITPKDYISNMAFSPSEKSLALLYEKYQELLRANNALDFDDLLFYSVRLFQSDPLTLEKYQNLFKYVMVDEFQDINTPQYEIVKMIAWKSRNICAVGDDYQAIYSWRGADVRYLLESFENDFPEAKIVRMERNYRSGQAILDAANEVISRITRGKEKHLWSSKPDEHPPLVRYQAQDQVDEARFVAKEVERLYKEEGRAWKDFAVLYRTNSQSRVFEEVFMARRIPFQVIGGLRFYERREVKDAVSLLSFVVNPLSDAHIRRILSWMGGIG